MKSIILASLLAFGSMFTFSGCNAEDAVEKVTGIEFSVIYFANGNSVGVNAEVDDNIDYIPTGEFEYYDYEGQDNNIDVSYTINAQRQGSTSLSNGNTHIYVSTDCNDAKYLTHKSSSSNRIQIVNLSGTTIENGDFSATINGENVLNITDTAPHCAITPLPVTSTRGTITVTRHSDGQTWTETLDEDYSFDIIVLPGNDISVVPLIGFSDLLNSI